MSDTTLTEEELDALEVGTYFVFQSTVRTDSGTDMAANDDVEESVFYRVKAGDDAMVEFASFERGPEFTGGLTSYVYGQDILMHRFQTDREYNPTTRRPTDGEEMDGIMSLDGELLEIVPQRWGTLRSSNGRYQVDWDSFYGDGGDMLTITDRSEGTVVEIPREGFQYQSERWDIEPFLIDDHGEYLYVREICGCEAVLNGLWEVHVSTGEIVKLSDDFIFDDWMMTSIDANAREMLIIDTDWEYSTDGPGRRLLPPTQVTLIDLETQESQVLLESEDMVMSSPRYRADQGSYLARSGEIYLFSIEDSEAPETAFESGWIYDWVDSWVVSKRYDLSTSEHPYVIKQVDTGEVFEFPEPASGYFTYVGAIVVD